MEYSFRQFKDQVKVNFEKCVGASEGLLFVTNADKDLLWETYISGFPEGSIRQGMNCNSCRQFIKTYGAVVYLNEKYDIQTFWDLPVDGDVYQAITEKLSSLVKSSVIMSPFFTETRKLGTNSNVQLLENKSTILWEHLFAKLPDNFSLTSGRDIPTRIGKARTDKDLLLKGLEEISTSALETVLSLINENNLYRGQEFKSNLEKFLNLKILYQLTDKPDAFTWAHYKSPVARLKNTAIGNLLINLSKGEDLDTSVRKFESLVAPSNYMRSKSIVSSAMITQAEQTIKDLGLEGCLTRRIARYEDLDVNKLIYTNRGLQSNLNVFAELKSEIPVSVDNYRNVEVLSLNKLLQEIIPASRGGDVRVFFESRHASNLMTLITGEPGLFSWNNGFSWSYGDGFADSIKERVKKAGGEVNGFFRFSLSWFNIDDLDLHVHECFKEGDYIVHYNKTSHKTGGTLDVDMNVGRHGAVKDPVENVIYSYSSHPEDGLYDVYVNQYTLRNRKDYGFTLEAVCDDFNQVYTFNYPKIVSGKIKVATFFYSKKEGLILKDKNCELFTQDTLKTRKIWNIETNQFHKVSTITYSPNYWDNPLGQNNGNKHVFFFLENSTPDNLPRAFFNENLRGDLYPHRKAFELVGEKLSVSDTPEGLSGLGFSLSKKDNFLVKVNNTVYKVEL